MATERGRAEYSEEEQRVIVTEVMQLMAAMLRYGELPECVGDAIVSTMLQTVKNSRGSIRKAAAALGIPRTTFANQLERGLPKVCHYLPMHGPLDDTLFPFIRVQWVNSDLGFLNEYAQWMVDVVQPRAHAENTKLVTLLNYENFQGTPTPEYVSAYAEKAQLSDLAVFRGVVVYGPNHPNLMTTLDPVNISNDFKTGFVRFATDQASALGHAVQLFSASGVSTIPALSFD